MRDVRGKQTDLCRIESQRRNRVVNGTCSHTYTVHINTAIVLRQHCDPSLCLTLLSVCLSHVGSCFLTVERDAVKQFAVTRVSADAVLTLKDQRSKVKGQGHAVT